MIPICHAESAYCKNLFMTQSPQDNSSPSFCWRQFVLPAGLIFLLTLVTYVPIFQTGFIWDDDDYVTQNVNLHDRSGLQRIWCEPGATHQYYPLVHTTFWIEYHLWKLHPLGYHVDNVLLHALAAILLWRVLLTLQVPGAWLAAAIFAVHPVEVESVAWVTERKNVLSAVLYFSAALAYWRYAAWQRVAAGPLSEEKNPGNSPFSPSLFYILALALYLAALLSKTVTCSLPAAILLVCWWKRGKLRWQDIFPLIPFFALGLGLGLMTAGLESTQVGAHGADWALSFWQRCLIAGRALWFYAGKLAWPMHLTFIYPRWQVSVDSWWQWVFPLAAAAVVAVLWFLRTLIGRGPLVGVLFFIGTLGPALGFVNVYPMRFSFVADHFQYLASVGLITLFAAGIARLRLLKKAAGSALCLLLLLALATLSWRQCGEYADVDTLWRATLAKNPDCWLAHNNLGAELAAHGNWADAISHYETSIQLYPNFAQSQGNLGIALAMQGRQAESIPYLEKAIQLNLSGPEIHYNLGVALASQRKWPEAIQQFERAIQLKPDYVDAYMQSGMALASLGKLDDAKARFNQALQINPGNIPIHNDLGIVLAMQGKLDEAVPHFEQVLRFNPDDLGAHINLARVLLRQGNSTEAALHFQQALALAQAQNNTALIQFIRTQLKSIPVASPPPQTP